MNSASSARCDVNSSSESAFVGSKKTYNNAFGDALHSNTFSNTYPPWISNISEVLFDTGHVKMDPMGLPGPGAATLCPSVMSPAVKRSGACEGYEQGEVLQC